MQNAAAMVMLAPVLSPHGALTLVRSREADAALVLEVERGVRLEQAFARGCGHGLLVLGADEVGTTLPPTLSFWQKFGARYVTALCSLPGIGERSKPPVPIPADGGLATMAAAVPPMTGAEYLTTEVLANLWRGMDAAFDAELAQSKLALQEFLKSRHPAWNLVGRVHFNLAENRQDDEAPFAFLATYTTQLSAERQGATSAARQGVAGIRGRRQQRRLLSLLLPVQRACEPVSVAESDGRRGRDFSSTAMDARRGVSAADATSRPRSGWRHRADARTLARQSSPTPAGDGHGWRQARRRGSARTRCSTSRWT